MTRPLKVGYHIPENERNVGWPAIKTLVRLAEEVGFDSIWVPDHLLYRFPGEPTVAPWECWTTLTAIAAVTERVTLGPLVLSTSFRNPALIAKMAATLDEVSGGRLQLALGAGWHEPEYAAYGFPYDHRVGRFEEAFTIIRTLLREGAIDFAGTYYTARECELLPRGPRAEGPPLILGSRGARMLSIAAPHIDGWNAWYLWGGNTPAGLAPILATVDDACVAAGRDPQRVTRSTAVLVQMAGSTGEVFLADRVAPPLAGSPAEIAEGLRGFARIGVSEVMIVLDPNTPASVEAFARVLEELDRPA
jgi:alkanesulfonate monooxygenase SsuD/methylene tetrahydromethanopterin reductase-like flavin-dependent oxidoreductase (luciferase family)